MFDQKEYLDFLGPTSPSVSSELSENPVNRIKSEDSSELPPSMRPKRAGRKLDTKEPESKRRAQNRAAQRAFRERKERHLKDLETRISELEEESATWRNSNRALRSRLSELEKELQDYRKPATPGSTTSGTSSGGAPQPLSSAIQPPSPAHSNMLKWPSSLASPSVTDSPSTSNTTPAQRALGSNPSSEEFCGQLSLECEIPKEQLLMSNLPGQQITPPTSHPTSTVSNSVPTPRQPPQQTPANPFNLPPTSASPPRAGRQDSVLDFSFAPTENTHQSFDIFEFLSSEQNPFDQMDPFNNQLLGFQEFSEPKGITAAPEPTVPAASPGAPALSAQPDLQHGGLPAALDFSDPSALATVPNPVFSASSLDSTAQEDVVPASTQKYIPCTEVWDRICSQPRFGEIDIQGMCTELRAKAKCSDTGVVLPERELERLLETYQRKAL